MEPHKETDNLITMEEKHTLEREMNAHTLQWGRMLKLGEKWNRSGKHWARVKNALRTRSCLNPPLYGMPKDHKPVPLGEEYLGPPVRPVVGVTESMNAQGPQAGPIR